MCNLQTTEYTLCGCLISETPVVCGLGASCPSYNKMTIVKEDSFCFECFMDAGVRFRWWGLVKELETENENENGVEDQVVGVQGEGEEEVKEEGKKEEGEESGKEKEKEKEKQNKHTHAPKESEDTEESEDEDEKDTPSKKKDKAGPPEPDFGLDVSRHCYPPVAVTLAYLRQRKEERREAEVQELKILYGEDYFDGI